MGKSGARQRACRHNKSDERFVVAAVFESGGQESGAAYHERRSVVLGSGLGRCFGGVRRAGLS